MNTFKQKLKTHLFGQSRTLHGAAFFAISGAVIEVFWLTYLLTYLLTYSESRQIVEAREACDCNAGLANAHIWPCGAKITQRFTMNMAQSVVKNKKQ